MHTWVFVYSTLGLIAFAVGAFLAWHPLHKKQGIPVIDPQTLPWLNRQFTVLCLIIGIAAYLTLSYALRIPTLQAVWSNYLGFLQFGLLIALLLFKERHDFRILLIALIAFLPMSLYLALISGHIGAAGTFLLQLLLIAAFWKGLQLRSLILSGIGFVLLLALMAGWLNSRDIIRSGSLNQLSITNRALTFMQQFDYINPLDIDLRAIDYKIFERVDMTIILVAQAHYQPTYQSYAYGSTIFSNLGAALVPRFIWPNKPIRLGGSDFVSRYTGLTWGRKTSVGLAYQFELYANGGAGAVIVGLFLFGWITAKLELMMFTGKSSLPHFMGLLTIINGIAYGSQTIVALIMSIVAGYIGVYLLGKLIEKLNNSWHFWQDNPSESGAKLPVTFERSSVSSYGVR